jgi:hypothetical protein
VSTRKQAHGFTRDQLVKRYEPGVVARIFERVKVIRLSASPPGEG